MTTSKYSGIAAIWAPLVIALFFATSAATADDKFFTGKFTGADMLKYCMIEGDESVRDFERGVCTGFVGGFAAGHHAAGLWHAFHHREENIDNVFGHLCVPIDANQTSLVALFVRYLESHTDKLSWNAGILLESALKEAYPCDSEKEAPEKKAEQKAKTEPKPK